MSFQIMRHQSAKAAVAALLLASMTSLAAPAAYAGQASDMTLNCLSGAGVQNSSSPSDAGLGRCVLAQNDGRIVIAKAKETCYFHHNCPDDGKWQGEYTKRQCANLKRKNGQYAGMSWGTGPTACETLP